MPINNSIINQKGTPAFYSDIFANRPTFGYAGRVFISTDTGAIYEDTGTSWTLIADAGAGTTGTLQQVTTNGSSTTVGLSTNGNGIGIGTTIPASNKLDIHSASGINATFNGTTTTNAALQLQNAGTGKWNIQNLYNAGANSFQVYDVLNSTARLTILNTGAATFSGIINADGGLEMSGQVLGFNQSGTRSWQVQATGGNLRFQSGDNLGTFSFLSPLSGTSATFTSSLTATAFIPSGATIPTNGMYLSAANTLNFATNSTNRLSIASTGGATFTGALNGTSATFSSDLRVSSGSKIYYETSGTGNSIFRDTSTGNSVFTSPVDFKFTNSGATTTYLTLTSSTGAATFLNTVTVGSRLTLNGIGTSELYSADASGLYLTAATNGGMYIASDNAIIFRKATSPFTEYMRILSTGIINTTSRLNVNGATDNALFSLNSGGTLYTVGFSPNATANSTNTLTLTTGQTTWIYTGTGLATWTLPTPSGTNQMFWIKNAGTGIITLNAFAGSNIIDNSATSVSSITIAVGATVLIQQDGNVKSYQLQ